MCCILESFLNVSKFLLLLLFIEIHFAIIIDNDQESTLHTDRGSDNAMELNQQAKATKGALEKLGFFVLYFNKFSSFSINQLLSAFKSAAADGSQLAAFALVFLGNLGIHHIYGSDNVAVAFHQALSCSDQLLSIPKIFFFCCPNQQKPNDQLSSDFDIPLENSIVLAVSSKEPVAKGEIISPAVSNFIDGLSVNNCRTRSLQHCFQQIEENCSNKFYCVYKERQSENFFLPTSYQPHTR